ncbi:MAG: hypothetical protein AABW88_03745 [Nanoarchaeota archaeon]|mgnify:CR=1 FL=1
MKPIKSAIALASLLAIAGCAGNKPKPVTKAIETPKYESLPTQTTSEKTISSSLAGKSLIYEVGNELISESLTNNSSTSFTASTAAKYGKIKNPRYFNNSTFFMKDGNLYSKSGDEISLIMKDVSPEEYKLIGNKLILINNEGNNLESLVLVNRDGSNINTILEDKVDFSDLDVIESGGKKLAVVCAKNGNNRKYIRIDTDSGAYDQIFLKSSIDKLVGRMAWIDENTLAYVRKDINGKSDIYSLKLKDSLLKPLPNGVKDKHIPYYTTLAGKRLTFENADSISFMTKSNDGLLYVSDGILSWRPIVKAVSPKQKISYSLGNPVDLKKNTYSPFFDIVRN